MGLEQLTVIERPFIRLPPERQLAIIRSVGELPVQSSVVVGMQLRERPPEYMLNYEATGQETYRHLLLRRSHARRWETYFKSHIANGSDHFHFGEAVIRYVLGLDVRVMHQHGHLSWEGLHFTDVDPTALEQGKGYAIFDDTAKHFVYGIDDPAQCLGSPGTGQALIISDTAQLMHLLHGHRIRQIGDRQ
jgi:hypothetical protein